MKTTWLPLTSFHFLTVSATVNLDGSRILSFDILRGHNNDEGFLSFLFFFLLNKHPQSLPFFSMRISLGLFFFFEYQENSGLSVKRKTPTSLKRQQEKKSPS